MPHDGMCDCIREKKVKSFYHVFAADPFQFLFALKDSATTGFCKCGQLSTSCCKVQNLTIKLILNI
jgi:hypothetical protein